jgi:hypothetical protein
MSSVVTWAAFRTPRRPRPCCRGPSRSTCCSAPRRAPGRRRGRLRGVDDRRQLLVVDLDQLGRVLRLQIGLGDDERDLVADVAHLLPGEHRMRRLVHRLAVLAVDQPAARQPADLRIDQLGAEHDVDDAGRLLRGVGRIAPMRACACGERTKTP